MPTVNAHNSLAVLLLAGVAALGPAAALPAAEVGAPGARAQALLEHRRSGVVSIRLSNGVLAHYRRIDTPQSRVVATVCIAGAERLEDQHTRGLSLLTAAVLSDWTIAAAAAAQETALAQTTATIDASVLADALQVRVSATPLDLESALRVATDLLLNPLVDQAALDEARDAIKSKIAEQSLQPGVRTAAALYDLVFPEHPPFATPPTDAVLDRYSPADVRRWLARHVTGVQGGAGAALEPMPVEAAIVGDLSLEQAIGLLERSLGRLPAREAISPAPAGFMPAPAIPNRPVLESTVATGRIPGKADVIEGFIAPDIERIGDVRTLRAAALVAAGRMRAGLQAKGIAFADGAADGDGGGGGGRMPGQIASGVDVQYLASPVPGGAMMLFSVRVDAADAQAARAVLAAELDRLVAEPPTVDELGPAVSSLTRQFQWLDKDLRYWSGVLARGTTMGVDPELAITAAEFYARLTPEQVRPVVAEWVPARRVRLIVLPEAAAGR